MTDMTKITARIKALIAKATSSEHEAEAEAFMAKAQQLLEQHQLDLGDLIDADDPVIINTDGFEQTESSASWYKDLYVAVGAMYGCRSVICPKLIHTRTGLNRWGYAIELTGRQSAVITAQLMFPWIKSQVFAEGRKLSKITGLPEKAQARRVGNALVRRIWNLVAIEKTKTQAASFHAHTPAARNALVTQDRVLAKFNEHYGQLGNARNSHTTTDSLSRDAAGSIGLHRQTGGSATLALR